MKIIAVISCPYGAVYTYLAAAALENAAQKNNVTIQVETHGSEGEDNPLSPSDIDAAAAVIVTRGRGFEKEERFRDKFLISIDIKDAVRNPESIITDAITQIKNKS